MLSRMPAPCARVDRGAVLDGGRRDGRMQQLLDRARRRAYGSPSATPSGCSACGRLDPSGRGRACRRSGNGALARRHPGDGRRADLAAVARRRDRSAQSRCLHAHGRGGRRTGGDRAARPLASLTPVVAAAAAGAAETLPLIAVTNLARAMEEIREAGVGSSAARRGAAHCLRGRPDRPAGVALGARGRPAAVDAREVRRLASIPLQGRTAA